MRYFNNENYEGLLWRIAVNPFQDSKDDMQALRDAVTALIGYAAVVSYRESLRNIAAAICEPDDKQYVKVRQAALDRAVDATNALIRLADDYCMPSPFMGNVMYQTEVEIFAWELANWLFLFRLQMTDLWKESVNNEE